MRRTMLWLLAVTANALAAEQFLPPVTTGCNDLDNPGRSPGRQFEMFFNIHLRNVVREEDIEPGSMAPEIDAQAWKTELPVQPPELSDPVKLDQRKLGLLGGGIYYYEADGKGGRRLCRTEEWANRTKVLFIPFRGDSKIIPRGIEHGNYSGRVLDRPPQPDQTHNPALAELAKTYVPVAATRYRYDAGGHLVEIVHFSELNWEAGSAKPADWRFDTGFGLRCRLYQPDGKLWRYVTSNSSNSSDCFNAKPETAHYFEYRYDANGKLVTSIQNMPDDESHWFEIWRMVVDGDHQLEADADGKVGVLHITGAVNRIAAKDNNPLNAKGGVYFFPNHDAPISLLDDFPKIYNYRRVRERGTGIARMVEAFPAGSSQLTARVWLNTYNNNLLRQEQYKDGKLVRVINTDFADEPMQEYYEEHLEKYAVKIKPANLVQRVYEYDDKGNEKLVAISWTNVPKKEFYGNGPSPGRIGPLVDLAKDAKKAWKNRGKPAQPKPARLEFYYGLPDGTVKWKDFDAFQKAFDIQENADWLYPKGPPKRF
jgi:hypothetical protein